MSLPTFEKKGDIPKGFESEYEEKDGKWVPKDSAAEIREALASEREKREAAEAATKLTAKELKKLQGDAAAHKAGVTEEQLKEMRATIRAEVEAEFAPFKAQAETLAAENRTLKLDNAIKKLAGEAGFLPTKLDDLWKLHGEEFDLTDDGKPMVKGKPAVEVAKHIEALKKLRPEWVQGSRADGGNTGGSRGSAPAAGAEDVVKQLFTNPASVVAAARAAGQTE
jgi:hypothetical protein